MIKNDWFQTGRRKEKKKVKLFPGHQDRADVSKEDGLDGIGELPATPVRPAKVIQMVAKCFFL